MSNLKAHLLLVEDDPNLGLLLKDYLALKGFEVTLAKNGEAGFEIFQNGTYDLCILDVMLPKMDGFTLAEKVRKLNKLTPIIFLTAKSQMEDLQNGFSLGADDYITKPFNSEELLLRINAVLRRSGNNNSKESDTASEVLVGSIVINQHEQCIYTVSEPDNKTKLTSKEFKLLTLLATNQNELVEREFILESIWKDSSYFNARSMDVYISKIRKHLSIDPSLKVVNVHGEGYKLLVSL